MKSVAGVCALAVALLLPEMAAAYVGPGAGLSVIGTAVAFVGVMVLLIAGFVWYPVKRLLRARAIGSRPRPDGGARP